MPIVHKERKSTSTNALKKLKESFSASPSPPVEQEIKTEGSINNFEFDPQKTYLVINGKPKEISNKSKYLLDMLIIEN
jgi:hypothetical protein